MEEGDLAARGNTRKICFIFYFILIEIIGIGCLGLAILSMKHEAVIKLRIWDQFEKLIPNLAPFLAIGAAVLTIVTPVIGLIGVLRKNQVTITIFFCAMTLVAFTWFGIGAWCVSHHKLIISNIDIIFERLERDANSPDSDAQSFLSDLKDNMPRFSHKRNLQCCQGSEENALLRLCAKDCGTRYASLFSTVVFPAIYGTVFGAGVFCMLSVLFACLVSCHLDDVKPAF